MKPLVSILIPAYKSEQWVADTLKSALAQTWENREIIVVDDGSPDGTYEVAQQFESAGVKVVRQPNQGAAAARNKAFSISRGDYIQWLDADDLLAPDKIEKQIRCLGQKQDKGFLLSSEWGSFSYRPDKAVFSRTALWEDLAASEWLIRKLDQNLFMQTGTWFVSRELTEAAGPWDTRLLGDDDGEYFCRVLMASCGTRFVPESKVFYRNSGPGSLSNIGRSEKKLRAHWLSMQLHVSYLRKLEDSERAKAACIKYLQRQMPYFYPEWQDLVRQIEALIVSLGGTPEPPTLSWKYAWIQKLFGWPAAKKAQLFYNQRKLTINNSWQRAMSRF
jgi:glycosyltransferase involved in cell wall biosynthesis